MVETVEVNWKCGKCDLMHRETFDGDDTSRKKVIELVALIVEGEDEPHLSVIVTRDGEKTNETSAVLLACMLAVIRGAI